MLLIATDVVLPSGWTVPAPPSITVTTGTMPQGASASPDASKLAVVESGYNLPALRIYDARNLHRITSFELKGAFGRPVWLDDHRVMVAGANTDSLVICDLQNHTMLATPVRAKTYPIAIAFSKNRDQLAIVGDNDDGTITIAPPSQIAKAQPIKVGERPFQAVFSPDGLTVYVSVRSGSSIKAIDVRTHKLTSIATGLHPGALMLRGDDLYICESDASTVSVYDTRHKTWRAHYFLGMTSSPNALSAQGDSIYVSLGAANSVAEIRNGRVVRTLGTGWYPTDVVPLGDRVAIIDGKGESAHPSEHYVPFAHSDVDYVGAIEVGSIRLLSLRDAPPPQQGSIGYSHAPTETVLRAHGPIQHVFFILKENRSYDQILGDMPEGNGDKKLVWFGQNVTPNQHALASRFGLFDNTYTNGEVSDAGHNWSDAAFANDYVEREWPSEYAQRRNEGDDTLSPSATAQNGYIWQAAVRQHISFRDYGEMANLDQGPKLPKLSDPSLRGLFDPNYQSFDLSYRDVDRVKEWKREFDGFLSSNSVPQLEYLWLPNDHTAGSRVGNYTPAAMIADNDAAVGQLVDAVSHSAIWNSSAIFIIEDDAQDGADHVSAQRTTLYIASPYAKGGVRHEHYSTASVLRSMELILGMKPLSNYDAKALPLYAAFTNEANSAPFDAIAPLIDVDKKNVKTAYAAQRSATLDLSRADAVDPAVMIDILAHNHTPR